MSRFFARIAAVFRNRTQVGVDKAGNRYFTRKEEIDGVSKWASSILSLSLAIFFLCLRLFLYICSEAFALLQFSTS